jgi:hypothetical protein
LESRSSLAQESLEKADSAFKDYMTFYGSLIESGVEETEYSKTFGRITENMRNLYATVKSNYDALMMTKKQFEEGRLERDSYERTLIRIEQNIIAAEFDLGVKVLPYFRKVEKDILNNHILRVIQEIKVTNQEKEEIKVEAEKIQTSMSMAEEEDATTQVEEYVGTGKKIMKLGHRLWKLAEITTPALVSSMIPIFMMH